MTESVRTRYPRTWTATIEVGRQSIDATRSTYDLLRDQTEVAVREASLFIDESSQVTVTLWKRTEARGVERDRTFTVCRDKRGRVVYQ